MRLFWLGLLVGVVIGAVSAMIYCEWSRTPSDEALIFHIPAQ
jgi:hypothetical protein